MAVVCCTTRVSAAEVADLILILLGFAALILV